MYVVLIISILSISYAIGFTVSKLFDKNSSQWKVFPALYTFLPAIISIAVYYIMNKELSFGKLSFIQIDSLFIIAGVLIPIVVFTCNVLLMRFIFGYSFKSGMDLRKAALEFPVNALVIVFFVAGEEIGWRGFLQEPLIDKFGPIGGIVILGLVWGIWHAPVALKGYNLSSHFWAEAFILYPFMCVCLSFPMAVITIRSGSIWPALVFHAVNNALGGIGLMMFDRKGSLIDLVPNMVTGLILLLPFALFL